VLNAGDYVLTIGDSNDIVPSDYELALMIVPPPDIFEVGMSAEDPVTISPGVPGPGAGTLETVFSQDHYDFTIPNDGTESTLTFGTCQGSSQLEWAILNTTTGEKIYSTVICSNKTQLLDTGNYTLITGYDNNTIPGNYEITLTATEP
jgi:hypothetical protein